MTILTFNH